MEVKQGLKLARIREILKMTNFYVRDRQMSYILRKSFLTLANKDLKEGTSQQNWKKWQASLDYMKSSFAIDNDESIDGRKLQFLELYKRVESKRLKDMQESEETATKVERNKLQEKLDLIETDFTKQWKDLVKNHSDEIFLQPALWQKQIVKPEPELKADELIDDSTEDLIKSFIQRDDVKISDIVDKNKLEDPPVEERESIFDEDYWYKLQRTRKYRINKFY